MTSLVEQKLVDALRQRKPCDFSSDVDPTINASLLRRILVDSGSADRPADQPLEILGACIEGTLDLRAASVKRPISFVKCDFEWEIDCTDARMSSTSFQECKLAGLKARYAEFDGNLLLRECRLVGPLDLTSATVSRDVDLRSSKLSDQAPILADRADVGGSVYLRDKFESEARISFEGAHIAATLDGIKGKFHNNNGVALALAAARIGGFCVFAQAEFQTKKVTAFSAPGAQIGGFLSLERATVEGQLMLRGVVIAANLNLNGASFKAPKKRAIDLERAKIGGDVLMMPVDKKSNNVDGAMVLWNASISGAFVIRGASIGPGEDPAFAIAAEGMQVGDYLLLARSDLKGQVMLRDVQIRRSLNFSGSTISNAKATALDLERAKIGGDLFIRPDEPTGTSSGARPRPALVDGGIVMTAATIGGSVQIRDGALKNDDQEVRFNRINVTGSFAFERINCGEGRLSLANAKVSALNDAGTEWPKKPGSLLLNGFEYNLLTGKAPTRWEKRLDWLRRAEPMPLRWWQRFGWLQCAELNKDETGNEFNPQPFMTLVTVLRRAGHDKDAKMIAINRHREARKFLGLWSPSWFGNVLMEVTCGHGYRPWLAAMWIGIFIGIGAWMFDLEQVDLVTLKDSTAFKADQKTYPPFDHILYSADVLLPVVNLQQKDYWAPTSKTASGHRARFYLPFHILAGWFFTTLFVVGVTGLIRRE